VSELSVFSKNVMMELWLLNCHLRCLLSECQCKKETTFLNVCFARQLLLLLTHTNNVFRLLVGSILLGILALRTWKDVATILCPTFAIQHHLSGDSRKDERKGSDDPIVIDTNDACQQTKLQDLHEVDVEGGQDAVKKRPVSSPENDDVNNEGAHIRKSSGQKTKSSQLLWAITVGLIGGSATMLTNAMGPILNVYLLSVAELSPQSYVGTRAMFFCFLNLGKIPMRIVGGTLGMPMMPLVLGLGIPSVVGVFLAKPIMLKMNEKTFVKLELAVVLFAGVRLCYMGIKG
jgi:hypothetical protein